MGRRKRHRKFGTTPTQVAVAPPATTPATDPILESTFKESAYKKALEGKEFSRFWNTVMKVAEAEPTEVREVYGKSGIKYAFDATAIDRERKRLLVVSKEHNGRTAAIAQADLQADQKELNVIVLRPIGVNLAPLVQELVSVVGTSVFPAKHINPVFGEATNKRRFYSHLDRALNLASVSGPVISQIVQLLEQLAMVSLTPSFGKTADISELMLNVAKLATLDLMEQDREFGVCPIPLYGFSPEEFEALILGADMERCSGILTGHGVYQYFFPPADHLALGLLDRETHLDRQTIQAKLEAVPQMGHPFGQPEILERTNSLGSVVDELKERGLCVEGEQTFEITQGGQTLRQTVKFKPREGVVSKVIKTLQKGNIGDIFKLFKP